MKTLPLFAFCLLTAVCSLRADGPPPAVQSQFDKMAKAMADQNYEAFVADGDKSFLLQVNKPVFEQAGQQLSAKLAGGYDATYFGELSRQGYSVYYWKLVFKEGGDDALASMSVKDGKVGGFFIQ